MKQIVFKNGVIGEDRPVFIIAEAGVNHNGDADVAHKLIDASVDAGADAVKFQTFVTEELVSPDTPLAGHHIANVPESSSHFELIKRLELPFAVFQDLKTHCEEKGVVFISTPYDISSVEYLIGLGVEVIKIASSEMTNLPLLDVVRSSGIPVILSTGMSAWDEILESVTFIREKHDNICVMKCTSNYPALPESINLRGIVKIREAFPDLLVGFSDHSEGPEISLAALGLGISVIERHFTLDKDAWGPDHKASMTPVEFNAFVRAVRKCEQATGSLDWGVQDEEFSQRKTMQKGVYARKTIRKGESVTIKDVKFLRPSSGLSPKKFYRHYAGRTVKEDIIINNVITSECFGD